MHVSVPVHSIQPSFFVSFYWHTVPAAQLHSCFLAERLYTCFRVDAKNKNRNAVDDDALLRCAMLLLVVLQQV